MLPVRSLYVQPLSSFFPTVVDVQNMRAGILRSRPSSREPSCYLLLYPDAPMLQSKLPRSL